MEIRKIDTAVVFIDPQNDVLSEKGANWGAVGASVVENKTIENMERIFEAAKARGYEVFISPHYFYPTDSGWNALEHRLQLPRLSHVERHDDRGPDLGRERLDECPCLLIDIGDCDVGSERAQPFGAAPRNGVRVGDADDQRLSPVERHSRLRDRHAVGLSSEEIVIWVLHCVGTGRSIAAALRCVRALDVFVNCSC
jgi:hypothetical protein